jgi:hypothetical protein
MAPLDTNRQRSAGALALGRDFEISSYFPHVALTARLTGRLFDNLAEAGLRVGAHDDDPYPVLDWVSSTGRGGMRIGAPDVEFVLRTRTGPLPPGYGVIPLLGRLQGMAGPAIGSMQFSIPSARQPELDGLHLRFDDAMLRLPPREGDAVGAGWRSLIDWYGIVCEALKVAYGYGDWEDMFLQSVVPPSRRDVLERHVDLLFRLNCFGPGLVAAIGKQRLLASPAEAVVALKYGGVLVGGKLRYAAADEGSFKATAEHLGMRTQR